MRKNYFTVAEWGGEKQIGVIGADTDEELNKKLKYALKDHFNQECLFSKLSIDEFSDGEEHMVSIVIYYDYENRENQDVMIAKTFLYE